MGSRWARVLRGLLASGVAIFVAALFHVAGGGAAPGPVPLALSLAFATIASIALTTQRLSLWRLTISVVLSQLLFHALFGLGGGTATFTAAGGMQAGGMQHMHSGSHLTMSISDAAGAHADMGILPSNPAMWLSHAAAVLVTVIALRFGERAFWGLRDTARMGVARLTRAALAAQSLASLPVVPRSSAIATVDTEPVHLRELGIPLGRLRHRGPPVAVAAF
ncbi:hypothetical protein [Leifsonia poae]|uniref:Uncharacterized protein n=1 Tax=Leifsonia poae TaxID=110933 RepID=A0A9W6H984_9MICO|nr:hypothetical protein [Leifsonia poae]GLJ75910.1 hypothetical protein GCM10017584_14840 [Leifsonia poae]